MPRLLCPPLFLDFIRESNRIEGIERDPTAEEIEAHERLFRFASMSVVALCQFQDVIAPGKSLRKTLGMNVRVGAHIAPSGGPEIVSCLQRIVARANRYDDPWKVHVKFELLHPFMDGNGRTGRALWAWNMMMLGNDPFAIPFLHRFYYQTLSTQR